MTVTPNRLHVAKVNGKSKLIETLATYPLKIIQNDRIGSSHSWVYSITYGGGLLAKDKVFLEIINDPNSVLVYLTQSSTKVFKSIVHAETDTGDGMIKAYPGKDFPLTTYDSYGFYRYYFDQH
eukprot:Awhi_evm1s571